MGIRTLSICRGQFAVLGLLVCAAPAARATTYTAKVLYPVGALPGSLITMPDTPGSADGGQVVGFFPAGPDVHAGLWNHNRVVFDLNPSNAYSSRAYATSGTQQVGQTTYRVSEVDGYTHAFLWNGTASSAVDLNPSGYPTSEAWGTNGSQQVGDVGTTTYQTHAALWSGSAASFTDLQPTGFDESSADGTDGARQVGSGHGSVTGGALHALLWAGSASSVIDLHPPGYASSVAYGVSGNQQVGFADLTTGGQDHAVLWTGTAASAIDLQPNTSGFDYSDALATDGIIQAGFGGPAGKHLALAWMGSADSVINLHSLLPSTMFQSAATGVDPAGDIFGVANDSSGYYAVEWVPDVPLPEPAALTLACAAAAVVLRRRRV